MTVHHGDLSTDLGGHARVAALLSVPSDLGEDRERRLEAVGEVAGLQAGARQGIRFRGAAPG